MSSKKCLLEHMTDPEHFQTNNWHEKKHFHSHSVLGFFSFYFINWCWVSSGFLQRYNLCQEKASNNPICCLNTFQASKDADFCANLRCGFELYSAHIIASKGKLDRVANGQHKIELYFSTQNRFVSFSQIEDKKK